MKLNKLTLIDLFAFTFQKNNNKICLDIYTICKTKMVKVKREKSRKWNVEKIKKEMLKQLINTSQNRVDLFPTQPVGLTRFILTRFRLKLLLFFVYNP